VARGLASEYASDFIGRKLLDALPYLRKRQVLLLKSPDETEQIYVLGAIMSAGSPSFGGGQETLLYVVANGPRTDLGAVAQLEDVDGCPLVRLNALVWQYLKVAAGDDCQSPRRQFPPHRIQR
jgi:hypothetical protein